MITLLYKSLEIIYTTFIRPILEYAALILDNCSQQEKRTVEKIQFKVARIATKVVSVQNYIIKLVGGY